MSDQDSSEKTEKATPHKIREALKKGMAAKSQDINSLFIMAGGLVLMYAIGESLIKRSFHLAREIMMSTDTLQYDISHLIAWSASIFFKGFGILAAYVVPIMILAVLVSIVQTGVIFSFFPLKPDIQKINPVKGFKRIFSVRMLVELVKSLLKIGFFGLVIYFSMVEFIPKFMGLSNRSPLTYIQFFISTAGILIFRLLLTLVLIALIDLLYVKWDHQKKLKMSKKELKDEYKRFEGDPLVKQKRKEIARELLEKSKSLSGVKEADVVITNPTHYAVAIKYDRQSMVAPKAVSKGSGPLAAKIRQIAGGYQIPVIESPTLARRLYKSTKVGAYIREDDYIDVAAILRKVYALRKQRLVAG